MVYYDSLYNGSLDVKMIEALVYVVKMNKPVLIHCEWFLETWFLFSWTLYFQYNHVPTLVTIRNRPKFRQIQTHSKYSKAIKIDKWVADLEDPQVLNTNSLKWAVFNELG